MTAASLSLACWYFHISRIADRLGMTWFGASWTSVEPVWKSVLNCQNLVTWFPYIAIWWINSKFPGGTMITSKNSSVARESSRVIILKSRLNSTGHSAGTSEVCDIFDRQTHVPNHWWQLMCSRVFQPWGRRNSMMAPVRNITHFLVSVAERTSYFCLARKLIWPLWSSHIFTQWGWLILLYPDHFPGQHKNGESPLNYLFLRTFREGRTYFLSAPFIAAEAQHHEESRLIYGPLASTLLDQGFPVEHELDAFSPPLTGTPLRRVKLLLCPQRREIPGQYFPETFMPLSYSNQDHTFMGDYIIPVLNQQTWLLLHLWRR